MCNLDAGFTTIVGGTAEIEEIAGVWHKFLRPPFDEVGEPRVRALAHTEGDVYHSPDCPAVITIDHEPELGGLVADHLRAAIRRYLPSATAVTEPGYYLGPVTTTPSAGGQGNVSVSPKNLHRIVVHPPSGIVGKGNRVAVIDTGDGLPNAAVTDFTVGAKPTPVTPIDMHGHGSAVAELIRVCNPAADVTTLRVCAAGLAASDEMYTALTYALWPRDRFNVVNVSLSSQLSGKCATSLGMTITAVAEWCQANSRGLSAHLVAAAGNKPQRFGYPAAVPGAVIVQALDWNGSPASYNTRIPSGTSTTYLASASGGEHNQGDTLGQVTVGTSGQDMVGTSFAAALVSADLAY